jgi:hypothetical protein
MPSAPERAAANTHGLLSLEKGRLEKLVPGRTVVAWPCVGAPAPGPPVPNAPRPRSRTARASGRALRPSHRSHCRWGRRRREEQGRRMWPHMEGYGPR